MNASETRPLDRERRVPLVLSAVGLVLVAAIALPISAWLVEAVATTADNWILPLQALLVLGVAAALAARRARPEHRRRDLALGLAAGVVALLVVDLVWWLLLAG